MKRALAVAFPLAALLAGVAPAGPIGGLQPNVDVLVLTRHHPRAATIDGPLTARVAASGETLLVDGTPQPGPLALPRARWSIALDDGTTRAYDGSLRIGAAGGELRVVAVLDLEDYVARAVAGETPSGTPREALRAQAIVARSYALAGGRRHPDAPLCDLAHCQALTPPDDPAHTLAARSAAEATRGEVLRLPSGEIARAVFHACCGGATADPRAVFGGEETTGARPTHDPRCANDAWAARLPLEEVEAAAARVLGRADAVRFARLQLERSPDGHVLRVVDTTSGRWAAGDALVRALDRTQGWSVVKSTRFAWSRVDSGVVMTGRGHGHGVGLCQRGAAAYARRGATAEEILSTYFAARLDEFRTSPASPVPAADGSAAPTRSGPSPTASAAAPPPAP